MTTLRNLFPQSSVSRQLIWITALFILTIVGIILFTIFTLQNQKQDALVVDLAGRQRMLHQRHMKEIILASQGHEIDYQGTRDLLLHTLQALIHGGMANINLQTHEQGLLPPAPNAEIVQKLEEQQALLREMMSKSNRFLASRSTTSDRFSDLNELLVLTVRLQDVSNEAVKLFDANSSEKISGMVEWEILISGIVGILGILLSRQVILMTKALEQTLVVQKQSERSLRESQSQYAQILDSAMDAIITINQEQRILLFNRAAEQMFQVPSGEVKGQVFTQLLSQSSCHLLTQHMDALCHRTGMGGYIWEEEGFVGRRRNGEEFPAEATLSKTTVADQNLYTIIFRDMNERRRMEAELVELQRNMSLHELTGHLQFHDFVGASSSLNVVFQQINKVARTDATVLITGETGTGKELVAQAIHNLSTRSEQRLFKVNCAALPKELVESELFGHEKGAFTGAISQKKGRFEMASGGTLLLDEIGELPLETQSKLLRVLQEQVFERVGGHQALHTDVRIIAATNRDLEQAVREGTFRKDLLYRLNIFPIHIPPLRERKEDVPVLTRHFIEIFSDRLRKPIESISPGALERLHHYDWPGNVRELANIIERAVILCEGTMIQIHHISLPATFSKVLDQPFPSLEEAEREHILKALERTGGIVGGTKGAATLLGLNRSTLLSRMRKLGIGPRLSSINGGDISPPR